MTGVDVVLSRSARLAPDAVAVIEWESGRQVSYAKLDAWVNAFAAYLQSEGLGLGDSVGLHLPNIAAFLVAQLGAMRAGCVPTYLNFRLSPEEAARQMRLSRARILVTSAEKAEALAGLPGYPDKILRADGTGRGTLDAILATGGTPRPVPGFDGSADAIIRFTSGSTGAPKGVIVSHRAWLARAMAMLTEEIKVEPSSTTMVLGPLSHQAGLFVLPTLLRQGTILMFEKFTIGKAVDAISTRDVARSQMVPTMLKFFLSDDGARQALGNWAPRQIVYGGSPVERAVLDEALDLLPETEFMQSYGSHEAGSITYLDGAAHRNPALRMSAGVPFLNVDLRLAEIQGREVGEVEVHSPWLPHARLTEQGRERITERWSPTGDLAVIEDGFLFLKDRANDVIISGGFNVYPVEVEQVINLHPAILTSAVTSEPDETWGERVVSHVVLRPNANAATLIEDLPAHCRRHLAGYKVPKQFHVIDEMPLNATGKPDRRKLSAPKWEGRERRIG